MDIKDIDLNGGTFKLNLPYNWVGWIIWAIGLIIVLAGIVVATGGIEGLVISSFGLLLMTL